MARNRPEGRRQRGVVVIIVSLMLVAFAGMLGLVIDLGHLFATRTALQNAADAAALAGARELDGTATGVNRAVAQAIAVAAQNDYDVTVPVAGGAGLGGLVVEVGDTADALVDASAVATDADASNKLFVRVSTGQRSISAWFAGLWGIASMQTQGVAVAGRASAELSIVAMCALPDDPANSQDNELGYERGVAYKVSEANPLAPGTIYWIDGAGGPGKCAGGTSASLPFACAGKLPFVTPVGGYVYTNTGVADAQLEALDSRFDVYTSKNKCDPAIAPPDQNIKEYRYTATTPGSPKAWMEPDPTRQSLAFVPVGSGDKPKPRASRTFADYGVLWAASRPIGATTADWPSGVGMALYGGAATGYPEPSPYAQTSGSFFAAPAPAHPGKANRRILNVAIVDCGGAGGSCRPLKVRGYARFFMQRKANVPGDKDIYVEFMGLLPESFPRGDVRLYR